jgi:membrane protein
MPQLHLSDPILVGMSLIGWYIGSSAVASTYGAAGGLIVLLLWVYYTSQIFLFGAELARAYASLLGSKRASAKPRTELQPAAGTGDRSSLVA